MNRPVRVYIAGAWGSTISEAIIVAAWQNSNVELAGMSLDRMDPAQVQAAAPDVLISAAHRWLINSKVRSAARLAAVGFHPSLLPAYRGSWPLWWALRNGESTVGITAFLLTDEVDAGPILLQAALPVTPADSFSGVYERVAKASMGMFDELIGQVRQRGAMPPSRSQDLGMGSMYSAPTTSQRVLGDALRVVRRTVTGVTRRD